MIELYIPNPEIKAEGTSTPPQITAERLDYYGQLFDSIDAASQAELRNAAYHLLSLMREVLNGRRS